MRVSLKKAFSILDGRLSTEMGDVYEMLNFIFSYNLMTHQVPTAMRHITMANPEWYSNGVDIINDIKRTNKTDDFFELMILIDKNFSTYEIELGKIDFKIDALAGLHQNNILN